MRNTDLFLYLHYKKQLPGFEKGSCYACMKITCHQRQ